MTTGTDQREPAGEIVPPHIGVADAVPLSQPELIQLDVSGAPDAKMPVPRQPDSPGGISEDEEETTHHDLRGHVALVEEHEGGESCQDRSDSCAFEHGWEQYIGTRPCSK
ncbi:hypothetical protein [Actinomyces israelii]|uniref:hypothetical protein n=1 Tax=Actinomyces israelii TaxID=1659 RepID=UPI002354F664|nr:hypothetical protein [Actinomyces israelii]